MNGNENMKTCGFLAVAAVVVAVAWWSCPAVAGKKEGSEVGKKLFPEFTDPAVVEQLAGPSLRPGRRQVAQVGSCQTEGPVGDTFARQLSG